jgi:hypothetical protein
MLKEFVFFAATIVAVATFGAPAKADDTGMAGALHDLRREKGRVCIVDHWHYGNGSGRNKKAAMADAVASWSSFTAMEYGSDWARFQRAASRSVSCSPSSYGVSCSIDGRPCR